MWEWRVFARRLGEGEALASAAAQEREDIYVLAEGLASTWSLKLRGGERLEAKRRKERAGELEDWEKLLSHALPVPPWEARRLARELTPVGRVPVRPLRSLAGVLDFLPASGLGPARSVCVRKRIRKRVDPAGSGLAEHTSLSVLGREFESLALEGDPDWIRAERAALLAAGTLPDDARVCGYAEFLLGLAP